VVLLAAESLGCGHGRAYGRVMGDVLRFPSRPAYDERPAATPGPEPLWREAAGGVLREERHQLGRTLSEVAGKSGISVQYLSEVERGRKEPSSEVLSAVAGALGLTMCELTIRVSRRFAGPVCLAA
jgi:ribosome-binding protein aMBF1 (putative translation factor)